MMIARKVKESLWNRKKENFSDQEKEKIYYDFVKLVETLNGKEKYVYHDHDDLDYYRIRDIEIEFRNVYDNNYYKPILAKSSF